jgi:hypothetical protein
MRRLVDLSMPVHADMVTFPRVPAPSLLVNETHAEFAERIGAADYGVDTFDPPVWATATTAAPVRAVAIVDD